MSRSRVTDSSVPAGHADIERLAARLAMLASEGGEADNAGRAVGALARRIGLTGGDLKRIFLLGVASVTDQAERDRLATEVASLRQSVAQLDADARHMAQERDALLASNDRLKARLNRVRLTAWACGLAGAGLAVGLTSFTAGLEPSGRAAASSPAADAAGLERRAAIVRPGGASLFREPQRAGSPVVALPGGQRLLVRRLVWKALFQWAEVETPDGWSGYVLTTEIDLS